MPGLVFDKTLNGFCRRYLDSSRGAPAQAAEILGAEKAVANSIAERLLYHPGISFQVYGENIPAAVLLKLFRLKGLEALLEQGAIQFVLWVPTVTYSVSEIEWVLPLQSGVLSSKPHADPEESATLGLNWSALGLTAPQKKDLARKLAATYVVPPPEYAAKGADFGIKGYETNKFASLGLPKTKDITKLAKSERERLCGLATEALEVATLAHFGLASTDSYELAALSDAETTHLAKAGHIEAKTDAIFKLEGMPNFGELLSSGAFRLEDIPSLRATKDAERFRAWMQTTQDGTDANVVAKEYLNAITKPSGFDAGAPKFLKTIIVSAASGKVSAIAGAAIGGMLAGPAGAIAGGHIGAVSGAVTGPVIDSGLGLFDAFFLEGWLKGWTPRHYLRRDVAAMMLKARGQAMPGRNDPCYCGSGKKFKKCCEP